MPSYAGQIAAIVQAVCTDCHSPTGSDSTRPFDTYAEIFAQRGEFLSQTYACQMPPLGSFRMSTDDRVALLTWLVCGAPNN